MANGMYEMLALLPESSDFTLQAAVAHFSKIGHGHANLRAELATSEGELQPSGFRVFFHDWAVVAWLESGKRVLSDSEEIAEENDLPAPSAVIGACSRRLSVWSDEDEDGNHTDEFSKYIDELRERFGALFLDPVNGGWWT